MRSLTNAWCILRTSGGKTLPLARSLAAAGFEVWTPQTVVTRRRGHSRERIEIDAPIIPSFVFVPAHRLADIARLLALPVNPHARFSIFRFAGRVPLIADRDVEALRTMEQVQAKRWQDAKDKAARDAMRKHKQHLATGSRVRMADGPYAGMTGVVEGGNDRNAKINFGFGWNVNIETWMVDSDGVWREQPLTGIAALAA